MSESMFRVYRGLELDEVAQFLTGAGVPGTGGDTAAAPRGSYYTNISTGALSMKVSSGSGTDKWAAMATESFAQNLALSGSSWREPVDIADTDVAHTTVALIKADLDADDLIQSVAVTVGMRILGVNVTGNKNVFIVGGSTGAWTLTEDVNLETSGDTVYVVAGTEAGKTYQFNATNWIWINSADATELGYIRTFTGKTGAGSETPTYNGTNTVVLNGDSLETAIAKLDLETGYQNTFTGKTAGGSETPSYSTNNFVANADSLETAIGKLDTELGPNVTNGTVILATAKINANITALDSEIGSIETYLGKIVGTGAPSYTSTNFVVAGSAVNTAISKLDATLGEISKQVSANAVTTITVIDTAVGANVAEWDIRVVEVADSANVYACKVFAATNDVIADFTKFAVLKMGVAIPGLIISAALNGNNIELSVTSTASVNVVARRLTSFT